MPRGTRSLDPLSPLPTKPRRCVGGESLVRNHPGHQVAATVLALVARPRLSRRHPARDTADGRPPATPPNEEESRRVDVLHGVRVLPVLFPGASDEAMVVTCMFWRHMREHSISLLERAYKCS